MSKEKKVLSIIIPAYNEANTIKEIIQKVKDVSLEHWDIEKEIIVIDDGSTDATKNILKHITGIQVLSHEKNKGKGAAIRTGLAQATGDIYIIQDADLELNPAEYPQLIQPILNKETQVVYGSRYLKNPYVSFKSMVGNCGVTYTANLLYGLHLSDEATGYKVFTKEVKDNIQLQCTRFEFCPEFTAKVAKKKYKIIEVPVSYAYRKPEEGKKVSWKDGVHAIWILLKYKFVE